MKKVLPLRDIIREMKKKERQLKNEIGEWQLSNERLERRCDRISSNLASSTFTALLERTRETEKKLVRFKLLLGHLLSKLATLESEELLRTYIRNTEVSLREDDWETIRRMSGNLRVVGTCNHCSISIYGRKGHGRPEPSSMPCGIAQCPYDADEGVVSLSKFMGKFK